MVHNFESSQNPDLIYKNETEFYNLTGTHESIHTTSENIKLQRRNLDLETPAYNIENRPRLHLSK